MDMFFNITMGLLTAGSSCGLFATFMDAANTSQDTPMEHNKAVALSILALAFCISSLAFYNRFV